MISVVIPLYNKEKYIENTIRCVLGQSFKDFELIIIDDGSSDSSLNLAMSIKDERLLVYSKKNGGVSSARNYGIKMAKYDYVAFLDADDEWSDSHLFTLVGLIKKYSNDAKVFVTNFARKYSENRVIENRVNEVKDVLIRNEDYYQFVDKKALLHTSCVCVKKSYLQEVSMFNEQISRGEDLDLWQRLVRNSNVAFSYIVTEFYLMDAQNNSKQCTNIEKSVLYCMDRCNLTGEETTFYRSMLYRKYVYLLIYERNFKEFIKLYRKQKIFL